MIVVTETKKLFTFEELDEDQQMDAVNYLCDLNGDFDWWVDELNYWSDQWTDKFGISFDSDHVYFSIDRDNYIQFAKGYIHIEDYRKLAKALGLNRSEKYWMKAGYLELYFENGRKVTHLEYNDMRPDDKIKKYRPEGLSIDVDDWFYGLCEELLSMLKKEYEGLTSEEAIIETIKANDYLFTSDGRLAEAI